MTTRNQFLVTPITLAMFAFAFVAGCNPTPRESSSALEKPSSHDADQAALDSTQVTNAASTGTSERDTEHGHKAGSHGGIMVSLGRDSYHVEAVVDSEGSIRLYTLGKDETRVIDIDSQALKGYVKADGDADSQSITFEPHPQEGDADNRTSLFVGNLPKELIGRKLDVTIPNMRIAGERFRLGFQTGQEAHGDLPEMPDKLADAEERELYLTPGGRYTAADVTANGNVTASQKFKGIKSAHDMNPQVGDRICPITKTKANPKFTWVIDGKPYQFCCPPCVDEFLKTAKASHDPLPEPDSFIN